MIKEIVNTAEQVKLETARFAKPDAVEGKKKFFKAIPGGYGEGDEFIAVANGDIRKIAKLHIDLSFSEIEKLLSSTIHEYRQTGLFTLVFQFERAAQKRFYDSGGQKAVYEFYLAHLDAVNNWDLVDLTAHYIIGTFLLDKKDRSHIYQLAETKDLWRERVAIISTFAFIRNMDFDDILNLAEKFISHQHGLIHKAVGWMLRETGNRNRLTEENFLKEHYKKMPRTMLRYAIEKFPEELRQKYLKGKI